MSASLQDLRKQLTDVCLRASERWLTAGSGGNISIRVPGTDRYLCTTTGVTFRDTAPDNVVLMDLAGMQLDHFDFKPSKEYRWHAGVFATCPDVNGVVHTHSTATMAFGICGVTPPHMTGQARAHLEEIQIVPLLEAYNRAEIVEDSAQAYLHCRLLGREPKLDF